MNTDQLENKVLTNLNMIKDYLNYIGASKDVQYALNDIIAKMEFIFNFDHDFTNNARFISFETEISNIIANQYSDGQISSDVLFARTLDKLVHEIRPYVSYSVVDKDNFITTHQWQVGVLAPERVKINTSNIG